METMIVLITVSLLRTGVALPLYFTARRNKLVNLYWLTAHFFSLVIAIPFAAVGTIDNRWIFWTFISISEIALIFFIHTTFYRGRSSALPFFLVLAIIGLFGGLYGTYINNFELSAWFVYPNAVLIWGWHLIEAFRAYDNIEEDKSTEDWVKSRYSLMITYSVFDLISAFLGVLTTTNLITGTALALVTVALNFASSITQIFTWVMPEWFRRWLNRNQKYSSQMESNTQTRLILEVIGSAMVTGSTLNRILCLFAIRTTVGKMLGTEDNVLIERRVRVMDYKDWIEVLSHPELQQLLLKNGSPSDVLTAIEKAKRVLTDKQSLLTLSAQ
jgi:hypothetical protein